MQRWLQFQTSYLIVDEALPDLEVVPDMFQRTNQAGKLNE